MPISKEEKQEIEKEITEQKEMEEIKLNQKNEH